MHLHNFSLFSASLSYLFQVLLLVRRKNTKKGHRPGARPRANVNLFPIHQHPIVISRCNGINLLPSLQGKKHAWIAPGLFGVKCVRDDSIQGSETDTFCLTLGRSLDHFFSLESCRPTYIGLCDRCQPAKKARLDIGSISREGNRHACFFPRRYQMQIEKLCAACMQEYAKVTLSRTRMVPVSRLGR